MIVWGGKVKVGNRTGHKNKFIDRALGVVKRKRLALERRKSA